MPKSPVQDPESAEYITPTEASKIVFLSTRQLTRYADEGKIRFIRPGSHRRYLRADIIALRTEKVGV